MEVNEFHWVVGDIVFYDSVAEHDGCEISTIPYYRKFLGNDVRGYYWVQDFYDFENDERIFSQPYLITSFESVTRKYLNEGVEGGYQSWYSDGQKKETGQFIDGLKHGEWTYWTKTPWQDDMFPGANGHASIRSSNVYSCNMNTAKKETIIYIRGKKEGESLGFFANGDLSYTGKYENSLKEGRWNFWRTNGQLRSIIDYKKGNEIYLIEWYENGQKSIERDASNGLLVWNKKGDLCFDETLPPERDINYHFTCN